MSDRYVDLIRLDTLGALLEHGHGIFGWCQDCAATYGHALRDIARALRRRHETVIALLVFSLGGRYCRLGDELRVFEAW